MNTLPYKMGDIVKLKSGGPPMTVSHFDEVDCFVNWFDGNELKQARIFHHQLEKVKQ